MKLKELCAYLDTEIPLSFQEGYDNSGLQVGMPEKEIHAALITLDVTEDVLDEAAFNSCDVIISHHPLIFNGLKKITGKTITERILLKAIKQETAIYSAHTNLDVIGSGVSRKMAEKLDLINVQVLSALKNKLLKLITYVPEDHLGKVMDAVFDAGAGKIGNYDKCGFTTHGAGSFRGLENSNPFAGEPGKLHFEKEVRFETVLYSHLKDKVVNALLSAHPYEEVAYDLYTLENENIEEGMGCMGELRDPVTEDEFLKKLSLIFNAKGIKYTRLSGRNISKVALCGGAGGILLNEAIASGAHAFVTSDVRYHSFFDASGKILLTDIGHFESEKYAVEILHDLIIKKFPTFALRFSEVNTNPINYL